jgi:site-specific DNA-cytosine methylase
LEIKNPCLTVGAGHGGSDEPKIMHDGVLRRLTPLEWERAQNLPDEYTSILKSKNERRGAIGNGWTVDVIAHIFSFLPQEFKNG